MPLRTPTFGKQIRDWRKAGDMSQAQLAEVMGVNQKTVSQWEERGIAYERTKLDQLDRALGQAEGTSARRFDELSQEAKDDPQALRNSVDDLNSAVAQLRRLVDELQGVLGQSTGAHRRA
jgi:transcriptional regulator with XRE-family HTH domain